MVSRASVPLQAAKLCAIAHVRRDRLRTALLSRGVALSLVEGDFKATKRYSFGWNGAE